MSGDTLALDNDDAIDPTEGVDQSERDWWLAQWRDERHARTDDEFPEVEDARFGAFWAAREPLE